MCDCQDCANDRHALETKLAAASDELVGAYSTIRSQASKIGHLNGQSIHAANMDPKATNVQILLENWLWLCRGRKRNDGRGRLPLIDPGKARWKIASAALAREPEGMTACMEAIEGLACKPFMLDTPPFRSQHGRPSQRKDDIEFALKDERQVEKARKWRAEVLGATEGVLFAAWQQLAATEGLYYFLWQDRAARDRFNAMPEHKRIAHRMRIAEAYDDAEQARVIELDKRRNRSAA